MRLMICLSILLVINHVKGDADYDEYDEEIQSKVLDLLMNRGINITNSIILNQKPGLNTVITNEVSSKPIAVKPFITEVVTSKPLPGEFEAISPLLTALEDPEYVIISSTGKPIVSQSIITKPGSVQSVITKPGIVQPVITKPGSVQSVITKPGSVQPVVTKPVSGQPVITKPVGGQPVITKPGGVKPVTSKPVGVKPVTTKPVTIKPAAVTSKPSVTNKPTGTKLNTTSNAVTSAAQVETTTRPPFFRNPCKCLNGVCTCCTGSILETFNQKACLKVLYDPDDFAFTAVMMLNERVLFKRKVSGKNPPPMCIRLPRVPAVKLCMRFANVYFSGANMHMCINVEASFQDFTLIDTSLDCIRIGTNGIASVQPEDGGGVAVVDEDDDFLIEDYDDSA